MYLQTYSSSMDFTRRRVIFIRCCLNKPGVNTIYKHIAGHLKFRLHMIVADCVLNPRKLPEEPSMLD